MNQTDADSTGESHDLLSDSLRANGYSSEEARSLSRLAEAQLHDLHSRAVALQRSARRLQMLSNAALLIAGFIASIFGFFLAGRLDAGGFSIWAVALLVLAAMNVVLAAYTVYRARRTASRLRDVLTKDFVIPRDRIGAMDFGIAVKSVGTLPATLPFTLGGDPNRPEGASDEREGQG